MMIHKQEKGFTLVELMIVVAIIGILAAIAIPQFAAYRIRGYNSSALSDLKNVVTSEAAFFADWQLYGVTDDLLAANAGAGGGVTLLGGDAVPAGGGDSLTADDNIPVNRSIPIGIGNNVRLFANTNAAAAGVAANISFTALAKHDNGDTYFAADGDVSLVYQDQVQGAAGTQLAAVGAVPADAIASVTGQDDIILVAAASPSGNGYAVK